MTKKHGQYVRASHEQAKRRALRSATAGSRGLLILLLLAACQPTVQIQAPDKPIEINLNVNIEHHVKVEIQKDLDSAMNKNSDIF